MKEHLTQISKILPNNKITTLVELASDGPLVKIVYSNKQNKIVRKIAMLKQKVVY